MDPVKLLAAGKIGEGKDLAWWKKILQNLEELVNLDEELTAMIKYQKGDNGCARMLTAMDEMLDKLINSTGIVGR